MKLPAYEYLTQKLIDRSPEAFKLFMPRRYVPPAKYVPPSYYGLTAAASLGILNSANENVTIIDYRAIIYQMVNLGMPSYFVAHDFGLAVSATDPPDDMTIADIQWPLDAMVFMLPEDLSFKLFKRFVPYIACCKLPPEGLDVPPSIQRLVPHAKGIRYEGDQGGMVIHGVVIVNEHPLDYSCAASSGRLIKDVVTDSRFKEVAPDEPWFEKIKESFTVTPEEDVFLINRMTAFICGLLLAIDSLPQLVEAGGLERPAKVKKGVEHEALWHPNFIGRKYVIQREQSLGGSHASPRMHWRRGHYRNQHFGKLRSQTKRIRIEPVLVSPQT